MRDMYAQRKDVCARRGQYTALPSWTALCPHRRYRPTHIAVGTNLNSPAHMDASRETIGAAGGASTLPLAGERTGLHVQGRVAVRTERSRSLTVQVGTTFGPVGITSASGNSPSGAYPEPSPETTPRTRGNLFADRMVSRLVKPICFASPSGAKMGDARRDGKAQSA